MKVVLHVREEDDASWSGGLRMQEHGVGRSRVKISMSFVEGVRRPTYLNIEIQGAGW